MDNNIDFIKNIINNLNTYKDVDIDMDFSYTPDKIVDKYLDDHVGEDMRNTEFDISDISDEFFQPLQEK